MHTKRFVGADMRRALEMVKEELGADAIILSNRRIAEGIEIVAAVDVVASPEPAGEEADGSTWFASELQQQEQNNRSAQARRLAQPQPAEPQGQSRFGQLLARQQQGQALEAKIEAARQRIINGTEAPRQPHSESSELSQRAFGNSPARPRAEPKPKPPSSAGIRSKAPWPAPAPVERRPANDRALRDLQEEMSRLREELRDMLDQRLNRLARDSEEGPRPAAQKIALRLGDMGFSGPWVSQSTAGLPSQDAKRQWAITLANLARRLPLAQTDLSRGGIFAFIGPTGAGKTATVCMLAASQVLAHGAEQVALVSLDKHRIGGTDSLRNLSQILDIPLRCVDQPTQLPQVLDSLRDRKLILIDTAGLSPVSKDFAPQLRQLARETRIRSLLVLAATSDTRVLRKTLQQYADGDCEACVLTHLDECQSLGASLSLLLERRLALAFTVDGQEIPSSLSPARAPALIARAVRMATPGMAGEAMGPAAAAKGQANTGSPMASLA